MFRIFIIAALYMHVTGCAHSDPWTKQDTVLYAAYVGTLAYDAHTTAEIRNYPRIEEGGQIARQVLGPNPSSSDTYQYFATLAISNYLIARALPDKWRDVWLGANSVIHFDAAHGNDGLYQKHDAWCSNGFRSYCKE